MIFCDIYQTDNRKLKRPFEWLCKRENNYATVAQRPASPRFRAAPTRRRIVPAVPPGFEIQLVVETIGAQARRIDDYIDLRLSKTWVARLIDGLCSANHYVWRTVFDRCA